MNRKWPHLIQIIYVWGNTWCQRGAQKKKKIMGKEGEVRTLIFLWDVDCWGLWQSRKEKLCYGVPIWRDT